MCHRSFRWLDDLVRLSLARTLFSTFNFLQTHRLSFFFFNIHNWNWNCKYVTFDFKWDSNNDTTFLHTLHCCFLNWKNFSKKNLFGTGTPINRDLFKVIILNYIITITTKLIYHCYRQMWYSFKKLLNSI